MSVAEAEEKPRRGKTAIDNETYDLLGKQLTTTPEDFNIHSKLKRFLDARKNMFETGGGFDWATAEAMAFGQRQHPRWPTEEFEEWARAKQQVNPEILGCHRFPAWGDWVPRIRARSLLIYGESGSDSVVSDMRANEVVSANPNFRAVSIPGAGHNVRRENFPQYRRVLSAFLDQPMEQHHERAAKR